MSKPMTLGEVLDKWEGKGRATFGQTGGAIHDFTQELRRALYGTDEPCPEPDFYHWVTTQPCCGTCHNTGRLKTPGVVERLEHDIAVSVTPDVGLRWLDAIRREIGEASP